MAFTSPRAVPPRRARRLNDDPRAFMTATPPVPIVLPPPAPVDNSGGYGGEGGGVGGSDGPGPVSSAPQPMLQPTAMASPLNPSSVFMGPGRFGPQNSIPGLGTGGLQSYDPRAAAQAAVAAALAQQAANPWQPPAAQPPRGVPMGNRPFDISRGDRTGHTGPAVMGGGGRPPERPFSDLGNFLGGVWDRTPLGMLGNALFGGERRNAAGPADGGRAGATSGRGGQVRGGGTGARGGGLTQGGPR